MTTAEHDACDAAVYLAAARTMISDKVHEGVI